MTWDLLLQIGAAAGGAYVSARLGIQAAMSAADKAHAAAIVAKQSADKAHERIDAILVRGQH
jgi:hypothetical protein